MAITLRNTKGSPLTHTELDANFSTLDAAIVDSGEIRTLIDSSYVLARTGNTYIDSDDFDTLFAAADIDNLSDGLTNKFLTGPNAAAVIDSNYVSARVGGGAVDAAITTFLGGNLNTSIIPNTTLTYSLGDSNYRFTDMWLAGQTLHLGDTSLSVTDGGLVVEDKFVVNASNVPAGLPGGGTPVTLRNPSWDSSSSGQYGFNFEHFGDEVVQTDTHTLVSGALSNTYDSSQGVQLPAAGYAWIFNSNNEVIWEGNQAINDGLGESDMYFGRGLAMTDSYAYIGVPGIDKVYQYRLDDPYNQIDSISIPDSGQTSASFGWSMDVSSPTGGYLLIGAPNYDSGGLPNIGRAYMYVNDSTSPIGTFKNPDPYPNANFGFDVATGGISSKGGTNFQSVVGAPGIQSTDGKLFKFGVNLIGDGDPWRDTAQTKDSVNGRDFIAVGEDETDQRRFGQSVAFTNNDKIVVTSAKDQNDVTYQGEAYILDSDMILQYRLTNPSPNEFGSPIGANFGAEMAANNSYVVVTAYGYMDSANDNWYKGRAYIYDISDGSLVNTLENPNDVGDSSSSATYNGGDRFGKGVFLDANSLLTISADMEDVDNQDSDQNAGIVYKYPAPAVPVDSSVFNGLFSSTWTNDSGLTVEIDPRYGKEVQDLTSLNLNDVVSIFDTKLATAKVNGAATTSAEDADGHVNVNIPLLGDNVYSNPRWSFSVKNGLSIPASDSRLTIDVSLQNQIIDIAAGGNEYLYLLDSDTNSPQKIHQYTMSTADSAATASLDGTLTLAGSNNKGIFVDVDGRYAFTIDDTSHKIERYNLSTKFDISTGTRDTAKTGTLPSANRPTTPGGFTFNRIGTKVYVTGGADAKIYQYGLSTPWDPSTIGFNKSFDVRLSKVGATSVKRIRINPTGSQIYINDARRLYGLTLSTNEDIATITFNSLPRNERFLEDGFDINIDGTKLYSLSLGGLEKVTPFDISGTTNGAIGFTTFYGKKLPVTSLAQIPFVADDPADWSTVPTSVDDAVNRMSNLIKSLNGGSPIP